MDKDELEERSNDLNRFLLMQINVCNNLKREEEKLGENSELKGNLGTIKKNYKELVKILSE